MKWRKSGIINPLLDDLIHTVIFLQLLEFIAQFAKYRRIVQYLLENMRIKRTPEAEKVGKRP